MEQQNNPNEPKSSDIYDKAAERRGRLFDPTGRIESLNADETKIADVRKHPFGLFLIYLQIFLAISLSLGLIIFLLPSLSDFIGVADSTLNAVASVIWLIVVSFGIIFAVLATRIYKGNQLIVSNESITQVLQVGLFNRKVSELSLGSVEDVTAQQGGILPTIFNYGTLRIETAGEQNNFTYAYCPNPNAYAKAILDARMDFIEKHGH